MITVFPGRPRRDTDANDLYATFLEPDSRRSRTPIGTCPDRDYRHHRTAPEGCKEVGRHQTIGRCSLLHHGRCSFRGQTYTRDESDQVRPLNPLEVGAAQRGR